MSTAEETRQVTVLLSTAIVSVFSGFLLGVYAIRGYLISPELAKEAKANYVDPVESDESDIDEADTILDHAPNWSNGEAADKRDGLKAKPTAPAETSKPKAAIVDSDEECKLVLVVRTDLGMTKGKIAAQAGHATLACFKELSRAAQRNPNSAEARILRRWERRGQKKVAVQIKSEDELTELMGIARSLGVTAEVIADAGRTQIDPGSLTVLGVGPAPESLINQVTGHLKLL
ncbi:related to PTH2 - Aminoacyl-tRNA hydrolase [Cephalotrichum gorgonifer]|uniref:peptidyl-tRNA hydrolase n=1 Tax=Cephalotrichum gorgonifer TaxID=2041049 RepID=A0AAE8N3L0_9PEZI|nr:related to PTH2 - Aminoacyl-tRNA hydrolase [Cephalotrichum gorgonifer]